MEAFNRTVTASAKPSSLDTSSVCETEQDYQSREILQAMLADIEEDHAYWLKKQLGLIEKTGLANYLQSQTGD